MCFINEVWFWTGIFGIVGSLGAVLIGNLLSGKYQLKVERLRLHEKESFEAYKKLYGFISHVEDIIFPPDDPRKDFITVMKNYYLNDVKPNMLFFTPVIRKTLHKLESQYEALSNPDIIPEISFDIFIDKHIFNSLKSLREMIEKETDRILYFKA